MSLVKAAQHLASKGRYGDDSILHVSHKEIAFLENMAGGSLPRNPDTGAKEAFFFLPFLAPLAGAATAAAPAVAAGAGALAAGLQTGLAAATGAAGTIGAGLGSAASTLGTLGTAGGAALSAAPTVASSLAPVAGSVGSGLGAGLGAAAPAIDTMTTGAITAAAPTAATTAATGAGGLPMSLGGIGSPLAATPTLPATTTAIPAAAPGAGPWGAGAVPGASAAGAGTFPAAPAAAMTEVGPWGATPVAGAGTFPTAPAAGMEAGSKGLLGGLGGALGNMDSTSMLQGLGLLSMMRGSGGGGGDDDEDEEKDISKETYKGGKPVFPDKDYKGGIDDEWDYFRGYAKGGKVKKGKGGSSDEAIVEGAVAALQGQSPNPQKAIELFVQTFGQQALQDLMSRMGMGGGLGAAQSHGQSDSIPAMIDGQQPAALSEGEWVVPSDVVSGLGNGSTEAGARQLQAMQDKVRAARGGPVGQPPVIDPNGMMPA